MNSNNGSLRRMARAASCPSPTRFWLRWTCQVRIGNGEVNSVVRPQPGRAPVDLHHLGEPVLDIEPVPDFVGLADLQRDARDDSPEKILGRKADDDRDNSGAGEQAF